jgi:NADPH:quinone reductase-like Zn-dependent oxidoreductase
VEAATLPTNALTAAQALDLLDLAPGSTLAVTGAGGAVGGYAVELALLRGLHVIGTGTLSGGGSSTGTGLDRAFVTRLGAAFVADDELLPTVDAVLDTASVGTPALAAVRDGGTYVGVARSAAPAAERGIRVDTVSVHSDGQLLRDLVNLVDTDRLTLRVADTFPFEEAAAAHTLLAGRGVRGRPVLLP